MFKPILVSILAFSLFTSASFHPFRSSPVTRSLASVIRITGEGSHVCTGFIVQPKTVLTAAHCLFGDMRADGELANLIKYDLYFDLAVLKLDNTVKGRLELRDDPVRVDEELVGIGYGNGWSVALALKQRVAIENQAIVSENAAGIIVDGGYVPGMSGGPLIDRDGRVVGIVQQSNGRIGYGVGVAMIKAFLLDAGVK